MHKETIGRELFTVRDLIVVGVAFSIFFSFFIGRALGFSGEVRYFVIVNDRGEKFIYPSDFSGTVNLESGGYSYTLTFKKGRVRIAKANCLDKLCQRTGEISLPGERIICLPGKLTITAFGEEKVDAVNR